jgi:chromosome segregation ATPase
LRIEEDVNDLTVVISQMSLKMESLSHESKGIVECRNRLKAVEKENLALIVKIGASKQLNEERAKEIENIKKELEACMKQTRRTLDEVKTDLKGELVKYSENAAASLKQARKSESSLIAENEQLTMMIDQMMIQLRTKDEEISTLKGYVLQSRQENVRLLFEDESSSRIIEEMSKHVQKLCKSNDQKSELCSKLKNYIACLQSEMADQSKNHESQESKSAQAITNMIHILQDSIVESLGDGKPDDPSKPFVPFYLR